MDKEATIVVSPMADHNTKGRICQCEKCGKQGCWLSDSSIDAVKEKTPDITDAEIHIICLDCFFSVAKEHKAKGEEVKILGITKTQMDEIKNAFRD